MTMPYYKILFSLLVMPFLLSNNQRQQACPRKMVSDNWNGTITWTKTSASKGKRKWDSNGKENAYSWDFSFEFKITVTFRNGKGTVVRADKTANWESDSTIFIHKDNKYMIEEKTKMIDCRGQAVSELSVEFSEDKKNYWISFDIPDCRGQILYEVRNNIHGNSSNPSLNEQQGGQITLPANFEGQPVGTNPEVLSGTFTETIPTPNDPGGSGIITKATWNLTKGAGKPELIVSPESDEVSYDDWMPEPGLNETTNGNALRIQLHLQDIGGGQSDIKAKFFELRLLNTSKQPGICLNAPIAPSTPKEDLRFLPQEGAFVSPDGQFIKLPSEDGENGEVTIASYDGGGWTILNAEAILENSTRIKGVLEQDKSKKDIPIPKNNTGGKIAQRWLDDNGNPGETEDKENSSGNGNDGDGLSAYEEYRGVMSEGKFIRLNPQTKELGIKLKKTDISLFSEGMQKFENATGIKVVKFYDNEIPTNRRINQNGVHANIYKQFALNLVTGTLPGNQSGKAFGSPGIPSDVSHVMIDQNNIHQAYQNDQSTASRMNTILPYTEKELLATVVAHEMAHGINASHHGSGPDPAIILQHPVVANSNPAERVFLFNGTEHTARPYTVDGQAGIPGNQQSGDLGCIMAINSLCDWVVHETSSTNFFYEVPIISLGTRLCTSSAGTGINTGGKYFGNASNGNCIIQLKLK